MNEQDWTDEQVQDVTEMVYDGWAALVSAAQDVSSADSAARVSSHEDRKRMLSSIKHVADTLTERYQEWDSIPTDRKSDALGWASQDGV